LALSVGLLNLLGYVFAQSLGVVESIVRPQVWLMMLFALAFAFSHLFPERWVQVAQSTVILLLSGPMTLVSPFAFFGMWFFVLAIILMYKYGFLSRWVIAKLIAVGTYYLPFLVMSVLSHEGGDGSTTRIASYLLFLASCLAFLYFIFEEEIRDLLASNKSKEKVLAAKDTELAVQAAEIARLEPLSVLGERVAHVAHSFKNQLNQISTVVFFLEQLHDERRAVDKLQEFTKTVNERIENILMISRAGVDLEPEEFDVARLLEGLRQVYLSERSFSDHATTELTSDGPLLLRAVRWDFILLVENILKNALEAIVDRGAHGTIRVDLSNGRLTIANDGGAMPLCGDCTGSCLDCRHYGHPGQTNKAGGSGHGLAQVFSTCRKNGWGLRLRTSGHWTIFEITLSARPSA
jgi:hypothetical protein